MLLLFSKCVIVEGLRDHCCVLCGVFYTQVVSRKHRPQTVKMQTSKLRVLYKTMKTVYGWRLFSLFRGV